ncbi:MAG: hypothetical protein A2001_16770 [Treponema sp. GWC1_61_84]|nr:MAG: hypothetical protein A2001_16770 [Treponema sp. GWC1_61_84]
MEESMRFKLFMVLIAASFALSCAGAPPPVPESPPPVAEAAPVVAPAPEPVPAPSAAADEKMALAKDRRAYVLKNGLEAYAPEPFAQAEKLLGEAEAALSSDRATAEARLDAALPLYDATIKDGFAKKIEESRAAADEAQKKADAEKAKVAAKEEYAAAAATYTRAKASVSSSRFPEAVLEYGEATTGFDAAAKLAAERRIAALEALEKADAVLSETEERLKAIEEEMGKPEGGVQ